MQINKSYYKYDSTLSGFSLAESLSSPQYLLNQKIDNSAVIAAAGSQYSAWNNYTIISNRNYKNVTMDSDVIMSSYTTTNTPIFLFGNAYGVTSFATGGVAAMLQNGYGAWGYDISNKSNNPQIAIKPVIGFNYSSIIAVPRISATNSAESGGGTYDYDEYFGTDNEIKYPYINRVVLQFYIGLSSRVLTDKFQIVPEFNGSIRGYKNFSISQKNFLVYSGNNGNNSSEIVLFGFPTGMCSLDTSNSGARFYGDMSAVAIRKFNSDRYGIYIKWYYDNSDKSGAEYFRKVINSSCPFYWAENKSIAISTKIDDTIQSSKMHLPIITDSGVLTDKDVTGQDIKKAKQFTWQAPEDVFNNNGWRGEDFIDPNTYTDKIDLSIPKLTTLDVFNRSFAITKNELDILANFLWNADESIFTEIVNGLKLFGENPINGIINLRLYPFDIAAKLSATGTQKIVIGRTNTGVDGIRLPENSNAIIDVGECTFFRNFRNFLDYEPYTHAQLYIPYVGTIPIPTSEFMGHTIKCKLIVDMVTGACTAVVFKNDMPMIYQQGVLGIDIPITGDNAVAYANSVLNGVIGAIPGLQQTAGHAGQTAKSAIGGKPSAGLSNIGYAAGGAASATMSLYEGFAQGTMYQSSGSSSPSCAIWTPQKPYFIVSRPIINAPDNYGAVVGYACEYEDTLSNVKGFTVCTNPKIGFAKSQIENDMINQYLESGVYL